MISEKTLQHPILVLMIFTLLGVMGTFILGNVAISLMPDTFSESLMCLGITADMYLQTGSV